MRKQIGVLGGNDAPVGREKIIKRVPLNYSWTNYNKFKKPSISI